MGENLAVKYVLKNVLIRAFKKLLNFIIIFLKVPDFSYEIFKTN